MLRAFKGLWLSLAFVFGPGLVVAGPVNINTADEAKLAEELVGIGPALAAAIVRDRTENGPYEAPEDLARVRGIAESVLENNRENILVKDAAAEPAEAPAPAEAE